jgi:putative intracellular protease/amidase
MAFRIVFPIYPGVTHLDFTGPHQFLSRLPGAVITIASMGGAPIEADGIRFASLAPLEDVVRCDLICVPGGAGTLACIEDEAFLHEIGRLAAGACYVTSVCSGSLILGAAGLLNGKRAACHWAWRDQLAAFGALPDPGRVVRDGHLITGGGVTAGIDFALTVIAEVAGAPTAQAIQLALEYARSRRSRAGCRKRRRRRPWKPAGAGLRRVPNRYGPPSGVRHNDSAFLMRFNRGNSLR